MSAVLELNMEREFESVVTQFYEARYELLQILLQIRKGAKEKEKPRRGRQRKEITVSEEEERGHSVDWFAEEPITGDDLPILLRGD